MIPDGNNVWQAYFLVLYIILLFHDAGKSRNYWNSWRRRPKICWQGWKWKTDGGKFSAADLVLDWAWMNEFPWTWSFAITQFYCMSTLWIFLEGYIFCKCQLFMMTWSSYQERKIWCLSLADFGDSKSSLLCRSAISSRIQVTAQETLTSIFRYFAYNWVLSLINNFDKKHSCDLPTCIIALVSVWRDSLHFPRKIWQILFLEHIYTLYSSSS